MNTGINQFEYVPRCRACLSTDIATTYREVSDWDKPSYLLRDCRDCGFKWLEHLACYKPTPEY